MPLILIDFYDKEIVVTWNGSSTYSTVPLACFFRNINITQNIISVRDGYSKVSGVKQKIAFSGRH